MKKLFMSVFMFLLTMIMLITSCSQGTSEITDQADIPEGVPLENSTEANTLTSPVQEPKPASFTVSGLTISPDEVMTDSTVTIEVSITNDAESGECEIVLKIDGDPSGIKKVFLDPGSTETIEFILDDLPVGEHTITVGELSTSFAVTEVSAPTIEPKPAQPPVDTAVKTDSTDTFDYKGVLFGEVSSLTVWIGNTDVISGKVNINGNDSRCPTIPFTFKWGDGLTTTSFFPTDHIYLDKDRNYVVTVTANYGSGKTDSKEVTVRFINSNVVPELLVDPVSLPVEYKVSIPEAMINLGSRMPGYRPSASLTVFDDSFFKDIPRETVEYVLTLVAMMQKEMANDNVFMINGKFEQLVLRDPKAGGMYSLWFTNPVSFGSGDYGFQGTIQWSSFMHEMGHNITLNSPAEYYYGGKTDGNANAIYSETMAQIFAHATGYQLLNHYKDYGISDELAIDINRSVVSSMQTVRYFYEKYVSTGSPFSSWNDYSTPEDETLLTFMTIAYKFFEHAEKESKGYMVPVKRMMALLQTFDSTKRSRYDPQSDSDAGEKFRATLMTSAVSYAFQKDLREEFRALNFPIDDETFDELYNNPAIKNVD